MVAQDIRKPHLKSQSRRRKSGPDEKTSYFKDLCPIQAALNQVFLRAKALQRVWKIVTWRWRMQLALNAPFGVLWVVDKTNPAVHAFDMYVITALHAARLAPMMGIA